MTSKSRYLMVAGDVVAALERLRALYDEEPETLTAVSDALDEFYFELESADLGFKADS